MSFVTRKIFCLAAIVGATTAIVNPQISAKIPAYQVANFNFNQKSTASDSAAGDLFGHAVAIAGKYALVSAAYDDDKGLLDSGAAYLFDIYTGKQLQKFVANDAAAEDRFGYAVAVAGRYALIGAAYDDDKGLVNSGAAYLFDLTTGRQLKLTPNDAAAGDLFSYSVAVTSRYAVVGAAYDDDKGLVDSGSAYVFDVSTGRQLQKFIVEDDAAEDCFGYAVAISGRYALIGAANDDNKGLVDSGAVYLFDVVTGKQIRKLTANDATGGARFGYAVAVSGNYALIGAAYDDDKGLVDSGAAYLFDITTGKQIHKFIANDDAAGDLFGHAVAISGRFAFIGAAYDDEGLLDSGAAYLFDVITGKQIRKYTANDPAAEDRFGYAVAIAGKHALAGSNYNDDKGLIDSGAAYLFDINKSRQIKKF